MNNPKITIITVVYNGATTLEQTMLSVLNQTYNNIEYIIVDGASSDGTLDIIANYELRIKNGEFPNVFFRYISESDKGIYDAMNKGIDMSTGEWINFMNAGDFFAKKDVLQKIFLQEKWIYADVIYGNAISYNKKGEKREQIARENPVFLKNGPIYRHGASFVKTSVHKEVKFDLSKESKLGYALDTNCIITLFNLKKTFQKVDIAVLYFDEEGISNRPYKSLWYNYLICSYGKKNKIKDFSLLLKNILSISLRYFLSFWGYGKKDGCVQNLRKN